MTYPEPVVAAIIINQKREILLCKSAKWKGKYVVPGGHIERGETMENALCREVMEETGLEIFDLELVGVKESIRKDGETLIWHYVVFDYLCRTHQTEVRLNHEAEDFAWVRYENIDNYDLDDYTRTFLHALFGLGKVVKKELFYNL